MAANVIEVLLKLRDELSSGLKTAGTGLSQFNLNSIAAFAGVTIGAGAAVLALKKMATGAAEAQRVDNLLADSLQRHNLYSAQNVKALQAQASATAAKVRADDEEIKGIQTLLIDSGVELNMLGEVTKATLDLAVAKRMDGVSAAQLIRMAFISESGALRGITTASDGAAGSSERLASITKQLNALFGGKAEADIRGSAGAYSEMAEALDELSEAAGKWLNKGGAPVARALDEQARALADWVENASGMEMWLAIILPNYQLFAQLLKHSAPALETAAEGFNDAGLGVAQLRAEIGPLADEIATVADDLERVAVAARNVGTPAPTPEGGYPVNAPIPTQWITELPETTAVALDETITAFDRFQVYLGDLGVTAKGVADNIGFCFSDAMMGMLQDGVNFTEGLIGAFKSMARQIIAQITAIAAKWLVLNIITGGGISFSSVALGKYQFGGVVPGAGRGDHVPILAEPGERVLTREGNASLERLIGQLAAGGGGGGGRSINIYLASPDTKTTRDSLRYGAFGREVAKAMGMA